MSLTTVAELKAVLGVGSLYSDAILQEVCDASDAVLLPMLWVKSEFAIAHSKTTTTATLYFETAHNFIVGDVVVITNCGSAWNGTKTITVVSELSITYTISAATAIDKNTLYPYGLVTGDITTDWTTDSAIQEASLMLSVDIFQARAVPSSGGVAIDGSASPWRMSNSLLAKIRGLISHATDPRSMVG
jgi:hypothetical protein